MTMPSLSDLFRRCLQANYITLGHSADVAIERIGDTLYIYLECSDGGDDWRNNIDFPSRAYAHADGTTWRAHRGFLKVWGELEEYVAPLVADEKIGHIVTVGYSHGGALATLCHEYIWYHRPDLRERIEGYGFGAPRVIWGVYGQDILSRWQRFTVIRNIDDIVTHLPPRLLGYTHVGQMLEIGEKGRYSCTAAHRPENILAELERGGGFGFKCRY